MPFTQVKAIIPTKMNTNAIRQAILAEMKKEGEEQSRALRKHVSDWTGDKPNFESSLTFEGDNAIVTTVATGNQKGVKKFGYLDKGTRIRWAIVINGRAVIAGRRAMQRRNIRPRPGIKARNWTNDLQRQRQPKFRQRMESANQRGLQRLYG